MTLLTRHFFRQNLLSTLLALLIGLSIYTLADLFDRIDNFIESGQTLLSVLWYYAMKTPMIVAQILPFCFLIASLAQLSLMARARELVALQAGGISFLRLARILFICGLFFGLLQFVFSQSVGVHAERLARDFWNQDVQQRNNDTLSVRNIWFEDGNYRVYMEVLLPRQGEGRNISIYQLGEGGTTVEHIFRAGSFRWNSQNGWTLAVVTEYDLKTYDGVLRNQVAIPLRVQPMDFLWYNAEVQRVTLPLWELGETIRVQQAAGSNVESLRTAWHMKLSTAASMMILALLAVAVITWRDNMYLCVFIGLFITFLLFMLNALSPTLGSQNILSPMLAAWLPNLLLLVVSVSRLAWFHWPHKLARQETAGPAA